MPFIRYTRDKRGYETTFVMHAYRPGNGGRGTRVLYLFRSPAHIRIGRQPLDEEAREALSTPIRISASTGTRSSREAVGHAL